MMKKRAKKRAAMPEETVLFPLPRRSRRSLEAEIYTRHIILRVGRRKIRVAHKELEGLQELVEECMYRLEIPGSRIASYK